VAKAEEPQRLIAFFADREKALAAARGDGDG
jgi:hypothetical protein